MQQENHHFYSFAYYLCKSSQQQVLLPLLYSYLVQMFTTAFSGYALFSL